MPRPVEIDFTGAPAAQGGGGDDYVAPGTYPLRLVSIEDGKSQSEKRMVTARWEVATNDAMGGRKLTDRFVIEIAPGQSKFPLQRLHAMLLAFGLPISEKKVRLDFDALEGKGVMGVIEDRIQPARGEFPERTVSNITAYHPLQKKATATAAPVQAAAPARPAPAAAPAPAEEPVAEASANGTGAVEDLAVISDEVEDIFA